MKNISKEVILKKITNEVIISCQSPDDSPFRFPNEIANLALTSQLGGSVGVRINSPENVRAVREKVGDDLIIIGIWKVYSEGSDVYITPTVEAVDALVEAGSNIVAIDATERFDVDGKQVRSIIPAIKQKHPEIAIMADCATIEDAYAAKELGADIISTTLSGYTEETKHISKETADFDLLSKMSEINDVLVLCEGRLWTREDVIKAFDTGADVCVVGTAVTNPIAITKRLVDASRNYFDKKGEEK